MAKTWGGLTRRQAIHPGTGADSESADAGRRERALTIAWISFACHHISRTHISRPHYFGSEKAI